MNDLTALFPKILANGLIELRKNTFATQIVSRNLDNEVAQQGKTIDVPIYKSGAVKDVAPGKDPVQADDTAPDVKQLTLDYWKEVDFYLTDREMGEIMNGAIPAILQQKVQDLASYMDASIYEVAKNRAYLVAGTPGTTPFATDTEDAREISKLLNKALCPKANRFMVIDPDAEFNAYGLPQFADASIAGSTDVIQAGNVGQRLGFNWLMTQNLPSHTKGTATGVATSGATAAGATTILLTATGAGTVVEGDKLTFAADSDNYYPVKSTVNLSGTAVAVTLTRPLEIAIPDANGVSLLSDFAANIALNPMGLTFAQRPLGDVVTAGAEVMEMTDSETGLTLRLEATRQNKQTKWSLDALWGIESFRPECLGIVAG